MGESDKKLIWSLMPPWITEKPERGMNPMFYGTGSYEEDIKVRNKVLKILGNT